MNYYQLMVSEKERIQQEIKKYNSMEQQFPQGELLCAKNGSGYKWYLAGSKKERYLPKNQLHLAKNLALKKYYEKKRCDLKRQLDACNAYLSKMVSPENSAEQLLLHPEFGRLLSEHFKPVNKTLEDWKNESYEKNEKYKEGLVIRGVSGTMLRSKSEGMIEMILFTHGIPFRYEAKLVINDVTLYPDFLIRHPQTAEYYYWEHFGMMDNVEYSNNVCEKLKLYCSNGIYPSINLITTYETKKNPLSVETVQNLINSYFL